MASTPPSAAALAAAHKRNTEDSIHFSVPGQPFDFFSNTSNDPITFSLNGQTIDACCAEALLQGVRGLVSETPTVQESALKLMQEEKHHDFAYFADEGAKLALEKHNAIGVDLYEEDHFYSEEEDEKISIKEQIMYEILLAKATQNPQICKALLETGDIDIVNDTFLNETEHDDDNFWGNGRNLDGKNALGKAWRRVRETLKNELVSSHRVSVRYGFSALLVEKIRLNTKKGIDILRPAHPVTQLTSIDRAPPSKKAALPEDEINKLEIDDGILDAIGQIFFRRRSPKKDAHDSKSAGDAHQHKKEHEHKDDHGHRKHAHKKEVPDSKTEKTDIKDHSDSRPRHPDVDDKHRDDEVFDPTKQSEEHAKKTDATSTKHADDHKKRTDATAKQQTDATLKQQTDGRPVNQFSARTAEREREGVHFSKQINHALHDLCDQKKWVMEEGDAQVKRIRVNEETTLEVTPQEVTCNTTSKDATEGVHALVQALKTICKPGGEVVIYHTDPRQLARLAQLCQNEGLRVVGQHNNKESYTADLEAKRNQRRTMDGPSSSRR